MVNALDTVVTLLTSNFVPQDGITPTITKIYTLPREKEPRPGEDFILIYSQTITRRPVGIGNPINAELIETISVDIRVRPSVSAQSDLTSDAHAIKVKEEVERVLYANFTSPGTGFTIADSNIDTIDFSNRARGFFRYVMRIRLINYCKDFTA